MNTKLTLKMDSEVIEAAKIYAKAQGRSLSALVESYLGLVAKKKDKTSSEDPLDKFQIGSFVKNMRTGKSVPADYDYKEELYKAMSEKYL